MSPQKYILTPPEELHPYVPEKYIEKLRRPSNGSTNNSKNGGNEINGLVLDEPDLESIIYPDFQPWKHSKNEDRILLNFAYKGYYSTSKVNFESVSARSSLQESLPTLTDQLSRDFSRAVYVRENEISRVSFYNDAPTTSCEILETLSGPGFCLPNRVTLTDQRKEQWLQELSLPYVSLSKIAKYIPHGLKRKQLLEQCYVKQIPLKRATWLIKTRYIIEWRTALNKNAKKQPNDSAVALKINLLREWTENFVHILEKLVFDMANYCNDSKQLRTWKKNVGYFLKLLGNCYSLGLLDKELLHQWLLSLLTKIKDFKLLPLALHILGVFWERMLEFPLEDAKSMLLITEMADALLSKYYSVSHCKYMINDEKYIVNDLKKNDKIKSSLLSVLGKLIRHLFQERYLEAFIFPPLSWELYKPYLYEIVMRPGDDSKMISQYKKELELISYRNESLSKSSYLKRVEASKDGITLLNELQFTDGVVNLASVDTELTRLLDENPLNFDWRTYVEQNIKYVSQLVQVLLWAIHPSRVSHYEAFQLVAKILLLKANFTDNSPDFVIEDIIWILVFKIAKLSEESRAKIVVDTSLFKLMNVLISYGIIKVPTYIRKLISSGILYLPESSDKYVHCNILINLKISPLMKSQYNMVLRNVMEYDLKYFELYNYDELLRKTEETKSRLVDGDFQLPEKLPLSIKSMVAEWLLTTLCQGELLPVTAETLITKFKLFCIHLESFQFFFKWIEFVVYHQILEDITAMEALMDILLCYEKLFFSLVDDPVLFVKTFIFAYKNTMKEKDHVAYSVTSFMPFWKFLLKNFGYELKVDSNLRTDLSSVYEEEKQRLDVLEKDSQKANELHDILSREDGRSSVFSSADNFSFPEAFSTSIKKFLGVKTELRQRYRSRQMLLLLMAINIREYNKCISVSLKRKALQVNDLMLLISSKLLSFNQLKVMVDSSFILNLLGSQCNSDHGLFYEYHKREYIRNNINSIWAKYEGSINEHYEALLTTTLEYGPTQKLLEPTIKNLVRLFRNFPESSQGILLDLLSLPHNRDRKIEWNVYNVSFEDVSNQYSVLDFTNLWIFQAYTCFKLDSSELETDEQIHDFLFNVLKVTGYNELCSRLFEFVAKPNTLRKVSNILEYEFFCNCLYDEGEMGIEYLNVTVETLTALSQAVQNISSGTLDLTDENFALISRIVESYDNKEVSWLSQRELEIDVFIKVFILHQVKIFDKMGTNYDEIPLLDGLFKLFEKFSFNLRLKLLVYEILASLKSHAICISSKSGNHHANKPLVEKLQALPPFQVSSFSDSAVSEVFGSFSDSNLSPDIEAEGAVTLNVKFSAIPKKANYDDLADVYLYDAKEQQYVQPLRQEPYVLVNNYQLDDSPESFNNTCLNLSLFNVRFQKTNPP